MSEIVTEMDFSEARVGDRVYTPLFKCKNIGDATNATISKILKDRLEVEVLLDKPTPFIRYPTFDFDGSFLKGGGQVLFWENPVKERSVKKGLIMPKTIRFNAFGLRHTQEHLDSMRDKFYTLSLKEQSEYADHITVQYVNSRVLIAQVRKYSVEIFSTYDVTTIGNLAYMVLYCHDAKAKEICCKLLKKYCDSKKREQKNNT